MKFRVRSSLFVKCAVAVSAWNIGNLHGAVPAQPLRLAQSLPPAPQPIPETSLPSAPSMTAPLSTPVPLPETNPYPVYQSSPSTPAPGPFGGSPPPGAAYSPSDRAGSQPSQPILPGSAIYSAPRSSTVVMPAPVNNFSFDSSGSPPPGTIGQTYRRRTELIPDDKHPRIGMVNVYVPEYADVSARGLKPKWNGEFWQLETEQPLLPGLPHIYAIKITQNTTGVPTTSVRWVRLIMGRIVELD